MTVASTPVNFAAQIEPHVPFKRISTRPELLELPFTSRISEICVYIVLSYEKVLNVSIHACT